LFSQDEQLARLSEENEKLKRTIDEISKNIDRLENGQGTYFVVLTKWLVNCVVLSFDLGFHIYFAKRDAKVLWGTPLAKNLLQLDK
jgi:hypothetical protein